MKIYEIGTGYTPIPAQVAAATESVVEELTKSYIEMGQSVEIIDISSSERAKNNLPITEVKVPSFFTKDDVSLGIIHKIKRVVYSVALAFRLKKILKSEKEKAVLHFHNQYNLFFFLKLVPEKIRAKAVIAYTNHNGMWSKNWDDVRDVLHKRYFQEIFAMKHADLIFVLNEKTRKNVVENLGVEEKRVIRISNGVNTDIYCPLPQTETEETKKKYKNKNLLCAFMYLLVVVGFSLILTSEEWIFLVLLLGVFLLCIMSPVGNIIKCSKSFSDEEANIELNKEIQKKMGKNKK